MEILGRPVREHIFPTENNRNRKLRNEHLETWGSAIKSARRIQTLNIKSNVWYENNQKGWNYLGEAIKGCASLQGLQIAFNT